MRSEEAPTFFFSPLVPRAPIGCRVRKCAPTRRRPGDIRAGPGWGCCPCCTAQLSSRCCAPTNYQAHLSTTSGVYAANPFRPTSTHTRTDRYTRTRDILNKERTITSTATNKTNSPMHKTTERTREITGTEKNQKKYGGGKTER
jgi:hypothetical protein